MVPTGMTSHVHAFDAREGGSFRISLTYDAPTGTGKTTAQTDTFHGRFLKLVPNEQVVEVVEFETKHPALRGEMTITIALADADGGTDIFAVHDGLPPGCRPPTTRPAGGRHSRNSRRSSRRARTRASSISPSGTRADRDVALSRSGPRASPRTTARSDAAAPRSR